MELLHGVLGVVGKTAPQGLVVVVVSGATSAPEFRVFGSLDHTAPRSTQVFPHQLVGS